MIRVAASARYSRVQVAPDLPIPTTFQQAALHAGTAGAAVLEGSQAALAAAPVAGAAGIIAAPVLLLRRRRRR